MQESNISAKVRQSCFSDPFSLQSKQLQPDYVSSYHIFYDVVACSQFGCLFSYEDVWYFAGGFFLFGDCRLYSDGYEKIWNDPPEKI